MKYQLFTYETDARSGTGIAIDGSFHDLAEATELLSMEAFEDSSIDGLLAFWQKAQNKLSAVVAGLQDHPEVARNSQLSLDSIRLCPPLQRPGVIYAAGANYRDHVEAMGRAFNMKLVLDPKAEGVDPWHFIKAGRGTLAGHQEVVVMPAHTQKLDWEAELAVVIGRHASNVSEADALQHVAGYSCANDLSARDNLVRQPVDPSSPFRFDWIGHKCFTGACPLGPFLTPAAFVETPENLAIRFWLNGELKQDSNTNNHLYSVAAQIAYLSSRLDLYPGDVILTGTPAGVGMETGTFLKCGDVMRVEIEGLGALENTIA